jgi:hypothetical protein
MIRSIKWSHKEPNQKGTGFNEISNSAVFDDTYGLTKYGAMSPKKFGILKEDGTFLLGQDAYNELLKPIWEGGKTFAELVPNGMKKGLSPILRLSNWQPVSVLPTEPGMYRTRTANSNRTWKYWQDTPLEVATYWAGLGVEEWLKVGDSTTRDIENPEYEPMQEKLNQFVELCKNTFTLAATYLFPNLPVNEQLIPDLKHRFNVSTVPDEWLWHWVELIDNEWQPITVREGDELANTDGNKIKKIVMMPINREDPLYTTRALGLANYKPVQTLMSKLVGL